MDTPNRWIRIGIRRETANVKPIPSTLNPSIERFELIALERPRLVFVFELNDDASFLHVSNTKSLMREWRDECRTLGKIVKFVEKRVPASSE